jgi:hypothetical protein
MAVNVGNVVLNGDRDISEPYYIIELPTPTSYLE